MRRSISRLSGIALLELLVATAVSAAMLGTLIAATVALQRGFSSVDYQVTSQQDQMRAMDYITRDLQRASAVSWTNNGRMLTVTVPDQSDTIGLPIHTPNILNGVISYGGSPSTVSYYVEGSNFIRAQDGNKATISTTIEEFIGSTTGTLASFQLAFTPRFSRGDVATRRAGARLSALVCLRNVGRSQ